MATERPSTESEVGWPGRRGQLRWRAEWWVGGARWLGRQARSVRFPDEAATPLVRAGSDAYQAALRWAARRAIAPNSVTGLSLLIGLCAAAWLSGGTAQDTQLGLVALAAWLVARLCAARLATVPALQPAGGHRPPARRPARRWAATVGSDWLVLPAFDWNAAAADATTATKSASATRWQAGHRDFDWLAASCGVAAECAVYGGIAAGAVASGWPGTWPLAIATVITVATAQVGSAGWQVAIAGGDGGTWAARVKAVLTAPSVRMLVAVAGLLAAGPRVALFAVLALGATSLACSTARIGGQRAGQDTVVGCRDDGPLARWAGRPIQGNLMPMPPVLAGLVAIALLSALGFQNLPGFIALAPLLVLLLAAPGSSHPHTGRLDWLVPALLCLGQFAYLVAFGAAHAVSGPVLFAACAVTAVGYTELSVIQTARQDNLGWDGRICLVGVAGMFGIAPFGYLGLAVCAGALTVRRVVIGYLLPPGEHQ